MATKLTKAELLARIDALELECARAIAAEDAALAFIEAQKAELDALYIEQRPSRAQHTAAAWPVITRGGVEFFKVKALEGGRWVTTYKPVHGIDAARQSLRQSARTHIGRIAAGA